MARTGAIPPAEGFDRFPKETLTFLRALAANNTRAWLAEHKTEYERVFKVPAERFSATMAGSLEGLTRQRHAHKIYRIHRDVRFAKDKTPYNAHLHISYTPEGARRAAPAWMFGVDPTRLTLGVGIFAFEPAVLDAYRKRAQQADGSKLHKLIERMRSSGIRVGEPELKRVPAGFDADSAPGDLLQRKGLTAWIDHNKPEAIETGKLIEGCMNDFKRLKPLFDWLSGM